MKPILIFAGILSAGLFMTGCETVAVHGDYGYQTAYYGSTPRYYGSRTYYDKTPPPSRGRYVKQSSRTYFRKTSHQDTGYRYQTQASHSRDSHYGSQGSYYRKPASHSKSTEVKNKKKDDKKNREWDH